MESNANPVMALLGFWMMMQLVLMLALLLGGIYALYCLGRAASGLDRLASAVQEWVNRQNRPPGSTPPVAPLGNFAEYRPPAPTPPMQVQPVTPAAPTAPAEIPPASAPPVP
jgi:hypothetical protein